MRRPLNLFFSPQTRLEAELQTIARSHQSIRIHQRGIMIWGTVAVVAAGFLAIRFLHEPFAAWLGPLLALNLITGAAIQFRGILRDKADIYAAARRIEKENPELDAILRTAAEQKADAQGKLNFMQQRLLDEALAHANASLWHQSPRRQSRWLAASHIVSIVAAFAFLVLGIRVSAPFSWNWSEFTSSSTGATASGMEISPGSIEIEKGTTVVIAARFNDTFPSTASLVWRQANGASGRSNMARSLSDPVYAFTLPEVAADTVYQVEYDGDRTADFTLTVFELPDLVRADAKLDYPDYTGLKDREFIDTRRVSAVAGAALDYEFLVNRSLASARLVTPDGEVVELEPRNDDSTAFGIAYTLIESQRFKLELTDRDGRTDPDPADIRIAVQANERPDLAMQFPRSDQRVSPLEELNIQVKVTDDFGLLDYGVAYAIGGNDPVYVSTAGESSSDLESNFTYLLALETHAVEVDELITWFGWADDFGPTGESRRSTSDLFFAEVRSLDEIFREGQGGGGPPGGGGENGPAGDLLEIQRQISVAIWNLQKSGEPSATFEPDVSTLEISQTQAREQINQVKERLDEARQQRAADDAARAMDDTIEHLTEARDEIDLDPLKSAWSSAQLAFRALLKLQPSEVNVTQGGPNSGGSGGRSQSQLNQLRFRQDQDNYASQSEAEAPATPEEREQLNVLARLKELARRQDDLNARLQELQTALAAAADEAEREEIRRELKRLEEEQRRMLAELDDTRSRVDQMQSGEQRAEATEQLEQTREDMQQVGEELAQGNVSQALASGTRAQESLEQTSEDLREDSSSLFSDEMRELRRQAREMAEQQAKIEAQWDQQGNGPPSLDGSSESEQLAQAVDSQRQRYEDLIDRLKQASSDSEDAEPVLHRRLYDVLRQQGTSGTEQQLRTATELLQRGFVDEARREQSGVNRSLDELRDSVERAANSVLGDESAESRFAQSELNELVRELRDEMSANGDQPGDQAARDGEGEGDQLGRAPGDQAGEEESLVASGEPGEGRAPGTEPGDGEARGPDANGEPNEPGEQLAANSPTPGQTPGPGQPGSNPGEQPSDQPGQTPGEGEGSLRVSSTSGQPGENPGQTPGQGSGQPTGNEPGPAPGNTPGESPGGEQPSPGNLLEQLAQALGTSPGGGDGGGGNRPNGPLTGESFAEWADRLRTIESLMDDPELRQRLAQARGRAEEMRRDWQREAAEPQWDLVDTGIIKPLEDARAWLRTELSRLEDPEILQPIDRDPVPEKYAESVRKYYEALSAAESEQTPSADR